MAKKKLAAAMAEPRAARALRDGGLLNGAGKARPEGKPGRAEVVRLLRAILTVLREINQRGGVA